MKRKEFAQKINVSEAYLCRLIKDGIVKLNKNGEIDYDAAVQSIAENAHPSRPRKSKIKIDTTKLEKKSMADIQKLKEIQRTRLLELQCRTLEGELVQYDDIKNKVFAFVRAYRDVIVTLPDRVAPILAAETDRNKIHEILTAEIRAALEEAGKNEI